MPRSGIGRGTALAFARGGEAVVVTAAVEAVTRRAVESFGRVDVWVNNAAVTMFGRLEDSPLEAYRRVIETNLMATCTEPAPPCRFREQGAGVLVNVASVLGASGQPYTSA